MFVFNSSRTVDRTNASPFSTTNMHLMAREHAINFCPQMEAAIASLLTFFSTQTISTPSPLNHYQHRVQTESHICPLKGRLTPTACRRTRGARGMCDRRFGGRGGGEGERYRSYNGGCCDDTLLPKCNL